jgi:hypothetical protein
MYLTVKLEGFLTKKPTLTANKRSNVNVGRLPKGLKYVVLALGVGVWVNYLRGNIDWVSLAISTGLVAVYWVIELCQR